MVENLTLTSPLEAPPDLIQAKLPSHTFTAVVRTPPGSHTNNCIHELVLCLHARVSYTHVLSSYLHLCLPLPVLFVYIPALGLTALHCPPTLTSLKLENSTLH